MLGKAEYVKFVLKSICEERINAFLQDKVILNQKGIKEAANNPCCDFSTYFFTVNGGKSSTIDNPGANLWDTFTNPTDRLTYALKKIYYAAQGAGSGDLATIGEKLTLAERCWICRKENIFSEGDPQSLIGYIEDEGKEYELFLEYLDCTELGFNHKFGNKEEEPSVEGSPIKKFFEGKCVVSNQKNDLDELKEMEVVEFLNLKKWYKEFIDEIPKTMVPYYRFAAFVSDNIGNTKKDKFSIRKIDGTAMAHAEEFSKKGQLSEFEETPGEWHLQGIFIDEVKKLKGAL